MCNQCSLRWLRKYWLENNAKILNIPHTLLPFSHISFQNLHAYICIQNTFAVQSLSRVWLFATLWTITRQVPLSFTLSQSLLKLHVHWVRMPSNHLILSPPPPSTLSLSQHQCLFQWVSSSHLVAKVLELQLQSFQWIFRVE